MHPLKHFFLIIISIFFASGILFADVEQNKFDDKMQTELLREFKLTLYAFYYLPNINPVGTAGVVAESCGLDFDLDFYRPIGETFVSFGNDVNFFTNDIESTKIFEKGFDKNAYIT